MKYRWHQGELATTVHAIAEESIGKHGVKRLWMLCGRKATAGPADQYWEGEDMAGLDTAQTQVQFPLECTLTGVSAFTLLQEPCKRCLRIATKPG